MSDTYARNQDARAYRVTSLAVDAKRLGQFWDLTPRSASRPRGPAG